MPDDKVECCGIDQSEAVAPALIFPEKEQNIPNLGNCFIKFFAILSSSAS
ncbi:MAG: hypothetical protein J0L97_06275 [Alphaproteobacteria bacterium]|nr:hypothetical protein [Alphaproteobacteria bacterium]